MKLVIRLLKSGVLFVRRLVKNLLLFVSGIVAIGLLVLVMGLGIMLVSAIGAGIAKIGGIVNPVLFVKNLYENGMLIPTVRDLVVVVLVFAAIRLTKVMSNFWKKTPMKRFFKDNTKNG